jgi:rhodanese-related sulfurtransferase
MAEDVRIEPIEAKRKVDAGEAIILDVVQPTSWSQMPEAIEDALRMEPAEVADRFHELPTDRDIIAYCT